MFDSYIVRLLKTPVIELSLFQFNRLIYDTQLIILAV